MKTYIVNQIASKRAIDRENYEHPHIYKNIGEFENKEEAESVYKETLTGMEHEKELILFDHENNIYETLLTTF